MTISSKDELHDVFRRAASGNRAAIIQLRDRYAVEVTGTTSLPTDAAGVFGDWYEAVTGIYPPNANARKVMLEESEDTLRGLGLTVRRLPCNS